MAQNGTQHPNRSAWPPAPYRALSLKQPANLRAALKTLINEKGDGPSDNLLMGLGLGVPSVEVAKVLSVTRADWIWVDAEHSPFNVNLLADVIQTINFYSEGHTAPVVRIPGLDAGFIAHVLDAGAGGIIMPHAEDPDEIRQLVSYSRFPPQGHRSYPPFAVIPGMTDQAPEGSSFLHVANDHIAVIPQVESAKGIENLEEICQIPGVDAIMIGAGDLRMDLGYPMGLLGDEPDFVAAFEKVKRVCAKYGKPIVGLAMNDELLQNRIKYGYRMLCVAADLFLLAFGSASALHEMKQGAQKLLKEAKDAGPELDVKAAAAAATGQTIASTD
ncbi:Phosphoenolpyruvate/pyruvate domain-containing protein [Ceraceosorus guamensis]|uniref:Phosphoenolpyruvate/pyruvate domain-containing protein n=1 Tax=Ceraceosorus guamensis TaxID=1522189 RepID=A0A316W0U8_9BASI|nr:Phosphoenolpyruvate/pyruvate domain-containing protein [Ceraceosorus guamensis]PWN43124.1 Phosphoenolpyruvate/pyruvate domain-containing protein [Ceraceosorus guamensis]